MVYNTVSDKKAVTSFVYRYGASTFVADLSLITIACGFIAFLRDNLP